MLFLAWIGVKDAEEEAKELTRAIVTFLVKLAKKSRDSTRRIYYTSPPPLGLSFISKTIVSQGENSNDALSAAALPTRASGIGHR